MKGFINGIDFLNMPAMRYWSFPSSYSMEKKQTELNSMLFSNNYVGAEKKDGYFEMVLKDEDGNIFMRSRDEGVNGIVEKHEWVPHLQDFFDRLPIGTCFIGEVYLNGKTSKGIVSILGCLKEKAIARQVKDEDKLRYYVFDVLAFGGELLYTRPMLHRVQTIMANIEPDYQHPFVDFAVYYFDANQIHENWLRILGEGGEGVVLVHKDYPYEPKKRTVRKTLKLKKELQETIDVFLTGRYKEATYSYTGKDIQNWEYWHDELTGERVFGKMSERLRIGDSLNAVTRLWYNGWAGAVEIGLMKDGKIVPIGWISGIDDTVRQGIVDDNEAYRFNVAELQAMEIDRSGVIPTLRHAKIIRWRSDKDYKSCAWSQIM